MRGAHDACCIDPEKGTIEHKRIHTDDVIVEADWLPEGEVEIGLTAGASTPDSKIGETVERVLRSAGHDPRELLDLRQEDHE